MKKILFALSTGFIFIAALCNCVYALNSERNVASVSKKNFTTSVQKPANLDSPVLMGNYISNLNYVNIWAMRDFLDRFDKVDNAMWFADVNGGFVSYFVRDGYGDRVIYDNKGRWLFSLITYSEDKLPKDIRQVVKSTYFDMAITLVEEVQTFKGDVYIVNLEDKSNIRVVKVNKDGEMEVLQDLNK
jgi:hypothetical protein